MPNPVLLIGTPPWVLPGANLDMDFANGRSFVKNGSKGFTSLLSCTRAQTVSSYALNSAGVLVPFVANTLRITDKGLLVEQTSTNLALWSRDFTNSAWVKVNATAALDQIGAEGATNAASSLTATANSGTALQTITLAASQRTLSFWLKRITGSGTIKISQDGITWTDVTASINSIGYSLVQLTATQLNPVIGFQFGTSGDKVAVDMAGLEVGAFATSPIPTTTVNVTRNFDAVTSATSPWFNENVGTFVLQFQTGQISLGGGSSPGMFDVDTNSGTNAKAYMFLNSATPQFRAYVAGSGIFSKSGAAISVGQTVKMAQTFDATTMQGAQGGVATTQTTGLTPPTGMTTLRLGKTVDAAAGMMTIQRLSFIPRLSSQAQLVSLTS